VKIKELENTLDEISTTDKKKALELIDEKLLKIKALFTEAQQIADSANVCFRFGGPDETYGMGGWYNPRVVWKQSDTCSFEEEESGWKASSSSC
jgi:hypothetical protein